MRCQLSECGTERDHQVELEMANIGYARVSTNRQAMEGQLAELRTAGCEKLYAEKESGAKNGSAALL
jgi:hypothetical protein